MREIKYRGIDTESGQWIYGGYVLLKSGVHCILNGEVSHMTLPDSHPHSPTYEELNVLNFHAVKYKTVGEWTGLKDKNKIDVYEGDILSREAFLNWLVKWHDGGFTVENITGVYESQHYPLTQIACDGRVIVGNIYENPELLK